MRTALCALIFITTFAVTSISAQQKCLFELGRDGLFGKEIDYKHNVLLERESLRSILFYSPALLAFFLKNWLKMFSKVAVAHSTLEVSIAVPVSLSCVRYMYPRLNFTFFIAS